MTARVLITGSRAWTNRETLNAALGDLFWLYADDFILVHGDCPTGADRMAQEWAESRGVSTERYPADWSQGKSAGPKRNQMMVDLGAEMCIAFFKNGEANRGTTDCSNTARNAGIPVAEVWG